MAVFRSICADFGRVASPRLLRQGPHHAIEFTPEAPATGCCRGLARLPAAERVNNAPCKRADSADGRTGWVNLLFFFLVFKLHCSKMQRIYFLEITLVLFISFHANVSTKILPHQLHAESILPNDQSDLHKFSAIIAATEPLRAKRCTKACSLLLHSLQSLHIHSDGRIHLLFISKEI